MPSAKYTFLTLTDEAALSAVLQEKFPDIRFFTHRKGRRLHYHKDISSSEDGEVDAVVVPTGWRPRFMPSKWAPGHFGITNYPDEVMMLRRSYHTYRRHENYSILNAGILQVGVTRTMSKAQLSFANKVWRLMTKIGTYRLLSESLDGRWVENTGKMWFAGNDAIRWALEDQERYFEDNGRFRPYVPQPD